MPQKNKSAKTSGKTTHFKSAFKKLLTYLLIVCSVVIMLFMANIFSNLLAIKTIANLNFQSATKDITVYAVSVLSVTDKQQAVDYAETVKDRLAGGYVLNNNGKFEVFASAYITENEAKNVADKLNESGEKASVVKINLPSITLNLNLTDSAKNVINESLALFFNSFKKLQSISLDYDKNNFNMVYAKNEISSLADKNKRIINKFLIQFKSNTSVKMAYIKIYLSELNESIDELLNINDQVELAWKIKYKYFEILQAYKNLQKEI